MSTPNFASAQPDMDYLLSQREVLEFSVHYGFLTLGWVTIDAVKDTIYNGEPAHTFRTIIRSNSSIPFVGKQERHFYSIFEVHGDSLFGRNFWTHDIAKGDLYDSRYVFDYEAGKVFIFENEEPLDTLALTRAADSGPLLFFLTRLYAGLNEQVDFPIYISEEEGNVLMDFTSRTERINVPAFGSVDAFYSSGNASVDGPFGFSGFYRAWHKADDLRVPLEAHVRVWVGNVRVRLISFERYD
jgi:hypothetical protein